MAVAIDDAGDSEASLSGENTLPCGSREEAIHIILNKLEKQLMKDVKGTIGDYLKLLQIAKEMGESRPRAIEITWVNSIREKDK